MTPPCLVPRPNARSPDFNARLMFDGKWGVWLLIERKPACCGFNPFLD